MRTISIFRYLSPVLLCLLCRSANAQFAVIDVASVAQLVQQSQTLAQQLASARAQLMQLQIQYQSMTGTRGMQSLLSGTVRNYLPTQWTEFSGLIDGTDSAFPALAAIYQGNMRANAVLPPDQVAGLSAQEQTQLQSGRQSAALLQAVAQDALVNASGRFAALQQLIDEIPAAADQKAILELQARIGAEQGMLQNEQTKLQILFQTAVGQDWARQQQDREQAIAAQGQFATRFEPTPR